MSRQDQFDQALTGLHDAALGNTEWSRAMAALDDACRVDGSQIAIVGNADSSSEVVFSRIYTRSLPYDPLEIEREYLLDFYPVDERVPRLLRLPHGRIVPNTSLYTELEQKKTSATWNDLLCRLGTSNQLNVRMDGPDSSIVVWVISRHIRTPDWDAEDLKVMQILLPHLLHAVRVRQALASAEALGASLPEQLDHPLLAVVLLDQRGKVVQASPRARRILHEGDGLSDHDGALSAQFVEDNMRLGKLLARTLPQFGREPTGGTLTVDRLSGLPPFTLRVSPIGVPNGDFGARRAVAAVWIVDPAGRFRIDVSSVERTLGLTAAQSRVAAAIAEGRTVCEVAAMERVSEATVRWHLKQVFARTGCSRQAELVRLVLSIPFGP